MDQKLSAEANDGAVKRLDKEQLTVLADLWTILKTVQNDKFTEKEQAAFDRLDAHFGTK